MNGLTTMNGPRSPVVGIPGRCNGTSLSTRSDDDDDDDDDAICMVNKRLSILYDRRWYVGCGARRRRRQLCRVTGVD